LFLKEDRALSTIRHRLSILTALSGSGLLISFAFFAGYSPIYEINRNSIVVFSFLTTVLLLGLSFREYRKYIFARLIIDNRIIHIEAAETEPESQKKKCFEIFVSCFGILLCSRIIKFNVEGIRLEKVEIGYDYILLDYGKGDKCETIRLLHGNINSPELQDIIEKFRRETGVIPEVKRSGVNI